ncbi:radical SAM protein [bacterium]|nr:radical SAM protein [bacterium]
MAIFPTRNPYPDLASFGERAEANPLHLAVEPTTVCNTKCVFCAHYYDNFGHHMEDGVFDIICESLLPTAKSVDLTGLGDPLTSPRFWPMFEQCQHHNIPLSFTTNGIRLRKEEFIARLVREDVLMRVSVDGSSKETFEFARPLIKWEDMIATLEKLKRHVEEAGSERRIRLMINFVAMKKNIADLPDMIRLAAKYGFECIEALPLGFEEDHELTKGQSLNDCPELVAEPVTEALRLATELGVELRLPGSFRDMVMMQNRGSGLTGAVRRAGRKVSLAKGVLQRRGVSRALEVARYGFGPKVKAGTSFCLAPWRQTYIEENGKVHACCRIIEPLGNLNEQSWEEIWNGPDYRNIRRTIMSWNPSAVCRYCHINMGITAGDEHYYDRFFSGFEREELPLDSPDIQRVEGCYDLEFDEDGAVSHFWTGKRAILSLPMKKGARFLRIQTLPRQPNGIMNPGMARVDDGEPEPFDNTCDCMHFPIDHVQGDRFELTLETENAWQIGEDTRHLSLLIKGLAFLS